MLLDPTNTEPIPVHKPPLAKVLAVFVVIIVLLNVALGGAYLVKLAREKKDSVSPEPTAETVLVPAVEQLSGTVTSVTENSFTVNVEHSTDPLVKGERTVNVSPETKITRIVPYDAETVKRNMEQFLKDMEAYAEKVEEFSPDGTTPFEEKAPEFPLSFVRETLDISALESGQVITLITADSVREEMSGITAVSVEIVPVLDDPEIP